MAWYFALFNQCLGCRRSWKERRRIDGSRPSDPARRGKSVFWQWCAQCRPGLYPKQAYEVLAMPKGGCR